MSVYAWHTGATVKLDGQELAPDVAARVVTVQVRDNVRLPDQASVRIADPGLLRDADGASVSIGQTLEILLGAPDATTTTSIFSGKVQSLELELVGDGAFIAATAYESAFELHRSHRTQVFQSMTSSDIASKVISDAGLTPVVDSTTTQHDFMLQCDESDWQFLWRLAADVDYEVVGEGAKVHFRAAGKADTGDPLELGPTDQLLSFRPRVTAAQQVSSVSVRGWDPSQQSAIVANKAPAATDSSPGLERTTVSGAVGSGTWTVAERTILTQAEAEDLGQSIADQIGNAWLEADGTCV
ncbi:MAG TPA: contractile injection system protein, VgrG/Pvc8 family, partial [Solirubrobacteraceae bacterium]